MIEPHIIREIVERATLAPSAHNAQPWEVRIHDSGLDISAAQARLLPHGDPQNRQTYISIGCFIHAVIVAAHARTLEARVQYDASDISHTAARISLTPGDAHTHTTDSVLDTRLTNRFPYKKEPVDTALTTCIEQQETASIECRVISDEAHRQAIARIASTASIESMKSAPFRKELAHHVLPNTSKRRVGIPARMMGIPTLASYLVPTLLRMFNMSTVSRKSDITLLSHGTPAFLVIGGPDTPEAWMQAGQLYMKIALECTARGYATAPWAAPVERAHLRSELNSLVGINGEVHILSRIGIPTKPTLPSPRLSVNDIIIDTT